MALQTLQEAADTYVVILFENANLCAVHVKRVTDVKRHPTGMRDLGGYG